MKTLTTEILIHASPQKVWSVLMDFPNYPNWNPFVRSISGEQQVGARLKVFFQSPGTNGMTFKPKVLAVNPQKEFRWKGNLLIPGIFDGEHYFLLQQLGPYDTRFTHGEKFGGILVPVFGKMLAKTAEGFEAMNLALKQECEK